jgi:MscS family membrane protein
VVLISLLFALQAFGQVIKPPNRVSKPAEPIEQHLVDTLGRDSPRGTLVGFLKYSRRGDYTTAARFLQAPTGRKGELEIRAQELQELMDLSFQGNVDFASERPEGTLDDGLPLDRERLGVLSVGDLRVNLVLVRVDDVPPFKLWLISKESVTEAQFLYKELRPSQILNRVPEVLTRPFLFSISGIQWTGWLISIPLAYWGSWCVVFLLGLPMHIATRVWKTAPGTLLSHFRSPFRYMTIILIHGAIVYWLRIPLFFRIYYTRFLIVLLLIGVFWFFFRAVAVGFDRALSSLGNWGAARGSLLTLVSRMIRVLLFLVGVLSIATVLGFDTKAMLTGLGIGGLAIALAGQKTLENIIGGASLLLDKAVKVGDLCRIGDKLGNVEDVGLRSLRLRMLDQTVLVVPNGVLATLQFENLASRTKLLINDSFSIRIETEMHQLEGLLKLLQDMLDGHEKVERDARARVVRFSGAAIELELFAYIVTTDWGEFTSIRQDIVMKIFGIVEKCGVKFAGPTQLAYLEGISSEGLRTKQYLSPEQVSPAVIPLPAKTASQSAK